MKYWQKKMPAFTTGGRHNGDGDLQRHQAKTVS